MKKTVYERLCALIGNDETYSFDGHDVYKLALERMTDCNGPLVRVTVTSKIYPDQENDFSVDNTGIVCGICLQKKPLLVPGITLPGTLKPEGLSEKELRDLGVGRAETLWNFVSTVVSCMDVAA